MKNIYKEENGKISKKLLVFYIAAITSCVVSVVIAIVMLVQGTDNMGPTVSNNTIDQSQQGNGDVSTEITDEELLANFETMYENAVTIKSLTVSPQKEYEQKELVFTVCTERKVQSGLYDVEIDVPYINIKNDAVATLNDKFVKVYVEWAKEIIEEENNGILDVTYQAVVQDNILSLIIYTELKLDSNPQKLLIETVNFDLEANKILTLAEYIEKEESLDKDAVQEVINNGVAKSQKSDDVLFELGYEVYQRDLESEIYLVDKTSFFYVDDEILYIIYPYGNIENTRKKDVIIVRK